MNQCEDLQTNSDYQLCQSQCEQLFTACLALCHPNEFQCFSDCNREYNLNLQKCPCMANCPNGCPCPEFVCSETTTTTTKATTTVPQDVSSFLMLSTRELTNRPAVISSNGAVNFDIDFTYEENTVAYNTCSVVFQSQFYIFGGFLVQHKDQVSRVEDCSLNIQSSKNGFLPGSCTVVQDSVIYLCFDGLYPKTCFYSSSPLGEFVRSASSNVNHKYGAHSAASEDSIIAIGDIDFNKASTELYNTISDSWSIEEDYPFHDEIRLAPTLYFDNAFTVFGSFPGVSTIAQFSLETKKWRKIGDLKIARYWSSVVPISENEYLVVGAYKNTVPMEKCFYQNGTIDCEEVGEPLSQDYANPELFPVDYFYCRNK